MPNYSGVWDLKEQGVAVKGGRWQSAPEFVFVSGNTGRMTNERINLASSGGTTFFGEIRSAAGSGSEFKAKAAFGNGVRGVWSCITGSSASTDIEYFTFASTAASQDFGDLTLASGSGSGLSNNTRGITAGLGDGASDNGIDYVTIASTGDATDFGDLSTASGFSASNSSKTRGCIAIGYNGSTYNNNSIDYITIASAGNGTDFGNMTESKSFVSSTSNLTRGIFAGGASQVTIDYITIASIGNATDFGDLTQTCRSGCAGSGSTKAIFARDDNSSTGSAAASTINIITMASTGDASDFGDLDTNGNGIFKAAVGQSTPSHQA